MPRPKMTTPVETTVAVLRSASDWAATYANQLERVFRDGFDGETKAIELADRLEEAERTYVREQREDVGLTNRRNQAVEETQKLVSSGLALAQIAFRDADNLQDVLADFSPIPPSRVRSPARARKAVTRLEAALEIHKEPMAEVLANLDEFQGEVEATAQKLEEVADDDANESQETRSAKRERDAARREAVGFVHNFQLAAEAVEFFQPDALEDLHAVFETHNPTGPTRTGDEELDEPSEDDTPERPVDSDAPGVEDDVVDSEGEVEEPVDA